jgi:hypothetical protein
VLKQKSGMRKCYSIVDFDINETKNNNHNGKPTREISDAGNRYC